MKFDMVQMSARIPKDRAFMMNSRPVYMVFVTGGYTGTYGSCTGTWRLRFKAGREDRLLRGIKSIRMLTAKDSNENLARTFWNISLSCFRVNNG